TTPSGGTVSIAPSAGPATPDPTGWKVFGSQLQITAPAATAAGPLQLVYTIAKSSLPDGAAPADISVLRDGVDAADCAAPGVANPDPCVSDRTVLGNGDLRITVLSVHASTWNLASVDAPAAPTTGGGTTPATP